jgi:hypothetical protein
MNNDNGITVTLSKQTTSVTLPKDPGLALKLFMKVGRKWVSWSELRDAWVINPTDAVRELEKQGALFQKKYKDTVTSNWEVHLDAPHYKYCGWHFEANSPHKETNTYKDLV